MSYDAEILKISRRPVTLAVITLDYCSLTYGVGACTATYPTYCYNTRATCKQLSSYVRSTKNYYFTSLKSPLPFKQGERPYLLSASYAPTEIKTSFTVNARVKIKLADEDDTDVGIDPYLSTRTSVQGTYWKKLLARNPYFKGRPIKIYEGFVPSGDDRYLKNEGGHFITDESGNRIEMEYDIDNPAGIFVQKWFGVIDNITLEKGAVIIEGVDILKSISKVEVPVKTECKLLSALTSATTNLMSIDSVTAFDTTGGYVCLQTEIIQYATLSTDAKTLINLQRGSFGTDITEYSTGQKIQKCRYFASQNPFDLLTTLLVADGGIASSYLNTTQIAAEKGLVSGIEQNMSRIMFKPTKVQDVFFEIIDLMDLRAWVGENLKINIKRNLPNKGGREYARISDDNSIIYKSGNVDLNQDSRLSRCAIYYNYSVTGDPDEPASYERIAAAIDIDAESSNEYGEISDKRFYCPWLHSSDGVSSAYDRYAANLVKRKLMRYRNPLKQINIAVEVKDSSIHTGDFVRITTDELLLTNGESLSSASYEVVRRDQRNESQINLKLQQTPDRRIGVISPTAYGGANTCYTTAGSSEREYAWICSTQGFMGNYDQGYRIY